MDASLTLSDRLRLLDEEEICRLLNIPTSKFRVLRRRRLIAYVKLGYRSFRYDPAEVRRALDNLRIKTTR